MDEMVLQYNERKCGPEMTLPYYTSSLDEVNELKSSFHCASHLQKLQSIWHHASSEMKTNHIVHSMSQVNEGYKLP